MYPTKAQLIAATAEDMRKYIDDAIERARLDTLQRSQDPSWLKERGIRSIPEWEPVEHELVITPVLPPVRSLLLQTQRERVLWLHRLKLHLTEIKPERHCCYALCSNYIAKGIGSLAYHGAVVRYEEPDPTSLWVMAPASATYLNVKFKVPAPAH